MTDLKGTNLVCSTCEGNGFLATGLGETTLCPSCAGNGVIPQIPTAAVGYTHTRWAKMIDETFDEVRFLAKAKGGEYSGDQDRLKNFRRQAADLDVPKELVWRIYAGKHWDAVNQYVHDLVHGVKRERMEPITGRIHDLIVYLLLLKAMEEERNS